VSAEVRLRPVAAEDLPVFFTHQQDPVAFEMAAFRPRERAAFFTHWKRILEDAAMTARTILLDDDVAGNVGCWEHEGERQVGYWIGREFWGQGIASRALALFLDEVTLRPLWARVARDNRSSIRVLEKCGFVRVGEEAGGDGVTELIYRRDP
jgi:RimJ/RimL family protein N-acetyltransferase